MPLLLSPSAILTGQMQKDSVYSIVASPHKILDVQSVWRQSGEFSFLFVEQTGTESRIVFKSFTGEADLGDPAIVLHSDTGTIRHPYLVENPYSLTEARLFWEQWKDGTAAITMATKDSAEWRSPVKLNESLHHQSGLSVAYSPGSATIGLAWTERDSITYMYISSDTTAWLGRYKLTPGRSVHNPTVFDDHSRAIIVWQERDSVSMLASATLIKYDYSVVVDTFATSGDNILPKFVGLSGWGLSEVIWSRRDSTNYNLYLNPDPGAPYQGSIAVTMDSVGDNFPGGMFTLPIIWKRGLRKTQQGDVLAYRRVVADSQAVVRNRRIAPYLYDPEREKDELWTFGEISSVGVTQSFYLLPLVYWVEKDSAGYVLKGRPTDFYLMSVEENETAPQTPILFQNFPNPFNPTTTIRYSLAERSYVTLKVFNVLGQEVAVLVKGMQEAADYNVEWDASDAPTGVYFYQLDAAGRTESKRMIFVK